MAPTTLTILYEHHAPSILFSIQRHLSSDKDAEDVLVETFLAAMESATFSALDESAQLAWLHKVAHNKCADLHRRNVRRPAISLEQGSHPLYADETHAPEQVALREEEQKQLRQHLALLPEQHQRVIFLRFGADMRCVDIARHLNIPQGTVRGWLSRSLNLLRTLYSQQ